MNVGGKHSLSRLNVVRPDDSPEDRRPLQSLDYYVVVVLSEPNPWLRTASVSSRGRAAEEADGVHGNT